MPWILLFCFLQLLDPLRVIQLLQCGIDDLLLTPKLFFKGGSAQTHLLIFSKVIPQKRNPAMGTLCLGRVTLGIGQQGFLIEVFFGVGGNLFLSGVRKKTQLL